MHYSSMHPRATDLCGDLLLDIGFTGHGPSSQALGKVVQTNTRLTEIIHNTKKPKQGLMKLN